MAQICTVPAFAGLCSKRIYCHSTTSRSWASMSTTPPQKVEDPMTTYQEHSSGTAEDGQMGGSPLTKVRDKRVRCNIESDLIAAQIGAALLVLGAGGACAMPTRDVAQTHEVPLNMPALIVPPKGHEGPDNTLPPTGDQLK